MTAAAFTTLDDDALATRARQDATALEALLERHGPSAVRVAHAILGNHADAVDAAQMALLYVAQNLAQGWSGQSFKGWFYVCAQHAALDLLRQNAARQRQTQRLALEKAGVTAMPESVLEQEEALAVLREELAALPDETRQQILLHHLDGLPLAEVASAAGCGVDACKQRLQRGRDVLRARLEKRGVALATLAFVSGLLDQLCGSARACAAEITPGEYSGMARKAVGAVLLAPAAAATGKAQTALTGAAHESALPAHANACAGRDTEGAHSMSKIKSGTALLAAVILLAASSGLLLFFNGSTFNRTGKIAPTTGTSGVTKNSAAKSGKADGTSVQAAPRAAPSWQPPRFISGNVSPMSISSAGMETGLLCRIEQPPNLTENKMTLYHSHDGGQNWGEPLKVDGYWTGTVSIGGRDNVALLASARADIGSYFCLRHDWVTFGAGGQLKPTTIWKPSASALFQEPPVVIRANGATWVFALSATGAGIRSINVARSTGEGPPKSVGEPITAYCQNAAAWATDALNAGFVSITSLTDRSLVHHITSDGGQSWTQQPVPLQLDDNSGNTNPYAGPLSIARSGQKLFLLLDCGSQLKIDPMEHTTWQMLLTSPDLGKTWSQPRMVSDTKYTRNIKSPSDSGVDNYYNAHTSAGILFTLNNRGISKFKSFLGFNTGGTYGFDLLFNFTRDDGENWTLHKEDSSEWSMYERPSAPYGSAIGGDEDSCHIAIRTIKNDPPGIIIKSFTSGAWQEQKDAPKTAEPAKSPQRDF